MICINKSQDQAPMPYLRSSDSKVLHREASALLPHSAHDELQSLKIASEDEPVLSPEQTVVLRRVLQGQSIFFTGSAGVGKSVLTRAIIKHLRAKYPYPDQVGVTASTGIAATNISGCTLHSWAGCGLGKEELEKMIWKIIKGNKSAAARWRSCKALIIDESGQSFI